MSKKIHILTQTIFLSDVPATKRCCLSSSGWNFTQYGTLRFVYREIHSPKIYIKNLILHPFWNVI